HAMEGFWTLPSTGQILTTLPQLPTVSWPMRFALHKRVLRRSARASNKKNPRHLGADLFVGNTGNSVVVFLEQLGIRIGLEQVVELRSILGFDDEDPAFAE